MSEINGPSVVLLVALASVAVAGETSSVGRVLSEGVEVDGLPVTRSAQLSGTSLVTAGSAPALVHLSTGQLLTIARGSTVLIDRQPKGTIRVSVRAGQATFHGKPTGVMTVGAKTVVSLGPSPAAVELPETGDDAPDAEVCLCHAPPGNPDKAHTICVGPSAVQAHVEQHGDTLGPCEQTCGESFPECDGSCPGTPMEPTICVQSVTGECRCEACFCGDDPGQSCDTGCFPCACF